MSVANNVVTQPFSVFAKAVATRFKELSGNELFVVQCTGDQLWEHYLQSFPEGSNPVYRQRTEYDCSCCRNFIKNLGRVVWIADGELMSVWSHHSVELEYPYRQVSDALDEFVRSKKIDTLFRTNQRSYGAEKTFEDVDQSGSNVKTWHHFYGSVAPRHYCDNVDQICGEAKNIVAVFQRGLTELDSESLLEVRDLINAGSLYRGEEHSASVKGFINLQRAYYGCKVAKREAWVWDNYSHPNSRFRNTVIGTLVQDLSEGKDLEDAVKMFESKVAPSNYKRPKSLITPRMIETAMKDVSEANLDGALQRRFAKISDVKVDDVLYVDNAVRGKMKGGVQALLMEEAVSTTPKLDNCAEIGIEEFMKTIVPNAKTVELLLENSLLSNFVSLTAPVNEDSGRLFKWSNDFAWSYDGNVADSLKQRVKAAGGNVEARIRASLGWFNYDDLDLHAKGPNGQHIHFRNKGLPPNGNLDVDMNAGMGRTRTPVENICWPDKITSGEWKIFVHNFSRRESIDVGFELEFEVEGVVRKFYHQKPLASRDYVECLKLDVLNNQIKKVTVCSNNLMEGSASQEKWNLQTGTLVRVDSIMLSPNYWQDNAVGNKHWIFTLHGCTNPEPTRGFYNEFLHPSLEKHRKVFEVLADKIKCAPSTDQLSGVGFSTTKREEVKMLVRSGKTAKPYLVKF